MGEFKPDDRVLIPAVIHAEYEGRTQPIYSVLALGDVPEDRVLPDHPELHAFSVWLTKVRGMGYGPLDVFQHITAYLDGYKAPEQIGIAVWDVADLLLGLVSELKACQEEDSNG